MASDEERKTFRDSLPDLTIPRFTSMCSQDAHEYAAEFKQNARPPWLHALYTHWLELLKEPFKGVTNDGNVRHGLYSLQDEGVEIDDIVEYTTHMLTLLNEKQIARVCYHIDAPEWRTWSNPEFLLSDKGIRLDELPEETRDSVMSILEIVLSPEGYEKAVAAMRINGFLGDLVNGTKVMNEFSYNFVLFGDPSTTAPWGFSFYGHHLCLNIFFHRSQVVISPWFTGAEPNIIDEGPHAGTRILYVEEALGLKLMQSLSPDLQEKARIYKLMKDPAMPKGRWNHDDQRHLLGAYRDNRVVPYEGIPFTKLNEAQLASAYGILEQYLLYLPERSRKMKLDHIKQFAGETYFCWIGGNADSDPFYYRIQSPVIVVEFDHHSGVFLTNSEPARFHIHTLLRTPNAGDYGMALRPFIAGEVKQEFIWEGEKL